MIESAGPRGPPYSWDLTELAGQRPEWSSQRGPATGDGFAAHLRRPEHASSWNRAADACVLHVMGSLLQDLRYGVRTLVKSPGFSLVAVVALALGIGANSAMFSIVNAVLLRPIPYPQPDRLLKVYSSTANFKQSSVSYPNFLDWRQRSRSFDGMAAYRTDNFNLTGQANPERLRGEMASATLFDALGVRPLIGRTFTGAEDQRGAAPVVVLTSGLWKSRFGGSPAVLGSSITLNDKLYTVIGVVPGDDVVFRRVSLVVPIGQWAEPLFWERGVGMGTRAIGRLKPGASPQQAQAELDGIAAGLAREFPKEDKASGIYALSLPTTFSATCARRSWCCWRPSDSSC